MALRDPPRPDVPGHRLTSLAEVLGHAFAKPDLLDEALTHASAAKRRGRGYERLEFLGDRVLGLVLADVLLKTFPKEREGDIAKRHARLVSRQALVQVARAIDLGKSIRLSKGEEGARTNEAVLADAMEAVIAALYLDGGLDVASVFVTARWKDLIAADAAPPRDAKTRLQEWAQARGLALPSYRELSRSGPAHEPQFVIEAKVAGFAPASGRAASKRAAEQAAAESLLAAIAGEGTGNV